MDTPVTAIATFVDQLIERDERAAVATAKGLLADGVSAPEVLSDLVAPAMSVVGDRWHRRELSVADEHCATDIAAAVVSAVVLASERAPTATGPSVFVVCAEGEWHVLAARVVAETFRLRGCDVVLLAGSMPGPDFARFVQRDPPDLIAVTSSTALSIEGVLEIVHVAHDVGIPVVAGGRGLGFDPTRAMVLGADVWAPDAIVGSELIWPLPTHLREPSADTGGAVEIGLHADRVVDEAMDELSQRLPLLASVTARQRGRIREDFVHVVRFAQAAVLVREPMLLEHFLTWFRITLTHRGFTDDVLLSSLRVLTNAAAPVPVLAGVLEAGLVRLTSGPQR